MSCLRRKEDLANHVSKETKHGKVVPLEDISCYTGQRGEKIVPMFW